MDAFIGGAGAGAALAYVPPQQALEEAQAQLLPQPLVLPPQA